MKTILLPTNYNNKLYCTAMYHIAAAPAVLVMESQLNQPYLFTTADGSCPEPVVFYLKHLVRIPMMDMPNCYTWPSHGLQAVDFRPWYMQHFKSTQDSLLAVYFYHRQQEWPGLEIMLPGSMNTEENES